MENVKNTELSTPVECPEEGIVEEPIKNIDCVVNKRKECIEKAIVEMVAEKELDAEIEESFRKAAEQDRVHEEENKEYEEAYRKMQDFEAIEKSREEETRKGEELIKKALELIGQI